MKNLKKVLALVLAVVMVMGAVVTTSAAYTDVKATDDYAEAIDVVSMVGILDGFPSGEFKSDATLTRAQAAKIYALLANAVTNGYIDSDIDELYANAINPFVDCNSSWALPYINYCRITGLCDGMTATTYEPNREVTGVQFLKFMLTTLGFDTSKEGYTGTGWDINVLNRANELGLTDGLADGWKAIAPITRGEAAQIIMNGLTSYIVEYGQKVTNNYVYGTATKADGTEVESPYYASSFISNEIVKATSKTLGGSFYWTTDIAYDEFERPVTAWYYLGNLKATYEIAPVASYTEQVNLCTILADLGVAKTNVTTGKLMEKHFVNGSEDTEFVKKGTKIYHTASTCEALTGIKVGSRGTLTQVFYLGATKGYRITEIETWLGQIEAVGTKTLRRDDHNNPAYNTLKVHYFSTAPTFEEEVVVTSTEGFAKGDYVLLTYSFKKNADQTNIGTVDIAKVTPVASKLTGLSADKTNVDGSWKYDAKHFNYGGDDATNYSCTVLTFDNTAKKVNSNLGETLGFIYDAYGNVIGIVNNTTSYNYCVIDWLYLTAEDGVAKLYADIVDFDANTTKKVAVAEIEGKDADWFAVYENKNTRAAEYGINNSSRYNTLYKYVVNADGEYVLTKDAQTELSACEIASGVAYISYVTDSKAYINDNTKFLLHMVDGSYKAFTGANIGTMYASKGWTIDLNADGIVDLVYLYGATVYSETEKNVGFIAADASNPADIVVKGDYIVAEVTAYFAGEAKTIYVNESNYAKYATNGDGFYTFHFIDLVDGVLIAEIDDWDTTANATYTVTSLSGNTLLVTDGGFKVASDVTVYDVYGGKVTKKDNTDLVVAGETVKLGFKAGTTIVNTIYIIDADGM